MNWNGWPRDPRVYTELRYEDKIRVIRLTERILGRLPETDNDSDMTELLDCATLFRAGRNLPVSAPPSPTVKARITYDTETPVTPDSYIVWPGGGRGGTRM